MSTTVERAVGPVPGAATVEEALRAEGLAPRTWRGRPDERYPWHTHAYRKILVCTAGSIVFRTGDGEFALAAGDRLHLGAGAPHMAVAGVDGVECVETPA